MPGRAPSSPARSTPSTTATGAWRSSRNGASASRSPSRLSIHNVDKPPLNFHDLRERAAQFDAGALCLTNTATFVEKARTFGAVTFVVGADTMRRIADPKYYPAGDMTDALDEIASLGCRFLVFGRRDGDRFVTLDDLDLPHGLGGRCEGVSEAAYRVDLSSTGIRATLKAD